MKKSLWLVPVLGTSLLMADSISPSSYTTTLSVGGTATIHKTVTVTKTATGPVDVFFLTDTTGSMSTAIASVRTGFSGIVTSLSGVAPNIAFGVGEYKDVVDSFAYRLDQDLTTNTADVQTALNGLSAGGGGDLPEANLFGLDQAATTSSWRAGSQRFLVWTGDAPGHDPSNGITEADATSALTAASIRTFAVDVGALDSSGQATRITAATGGQVASGGYSAAAALIQSLLTTSITNYSLVSLGVTPPAGVGVSITPSAGISGTFDRTTDRTFEFDVTFTGLAPGTYSFGLNALVDSGIIATEADTITVAGSAVPEPSTWAMIVLGLGSVAAMRRRRFNR